MAQAGTATIQRETIANPVVVPCLSVLEAAWHIFYTKDLSKARRPGLAQRRVNVDFPLWMIESLDREAKRLGVTRQSVIKVWIADRLRQKASGA